MAKSRTNLPSMAAKLATPTINGRAANKLAVPTSLATGSKVAGAPRTMAKPGRSNDVRASSLNAKSLPTGIQFGSPSSTRSSSSTAGSQWSTLLQHAASGGLSSVLSGGLAGFAGLGTLVSGVLSLFGGGGGKSSPPPLVRFQAPTSQDQVQYVGSSSNAAGSSTASGGTTVGGGGGYKAHQPIALPLAAPGPTSSQNSQVVQAVKQALLNSSSLNDVIAEI